MSHYAEEDFRGYNASKKEYFYGLKVNMIATAEGQLFEVVLCPGKYHGNEPFKMMRLGLPERRIFMNIAPIQIIKEKKSLESEVSKLL